MAPASAAIDAAARGSYAILRFPFPVQHGLEALDARIAPTKQ